MKNKLFLLSLLVTSTCIFAAEPQYFSKNNTFASNNYVRNIAINSNQKIKNVILFIGDGMGPNHVSAAEILKGSPLTFSNENNQDWTFHGYSNSDSLTSNGFYLDESKSLLRPELNPTLYDNAESPYSATGNYMAHTCYTDSAAGGTAIATGRKTNNANLSVGPTGESYDTLVEIATSLGKKTGIVSSDKVTGATPSSFVVHVDERHKGNDILNQMATCDANLIMAEKPSEWSDEYATKFKNNNWHVATSINEMNIEADKEFIVLDNLLAGSSLTPSLEDLTAYSLDKLDNNKEGFFLMVEASDIDTASHANQAGTVIQSVLELDRAVQVATEWASQRNDTIIIVTADHETGALYYDRNTTTAENLFDNVKFLSYNHSRTRVPIDVYGDISEFTNTYSDVLSRLGTLDAGMETESSNYWDNTDIFKLCASYL